MKITHFVTHFYPVVGGLEESVYRLSLGSQKLGHEVTILTTNYTDTNDRLQPCEFDYDGVHVVRLNTWRFIYNGLTFPLTTKVLNEIITRSDVVHVHTLHTLFVPLIRQMRRRNQALAISVLAYGYTKKHPSLLLRTFGPLYEKILLGLGKSFDIFFVKSNRDKIRLIKEGLEPIQVPEGVPEYSFEKHDPHVFRERYNIVSDNVILFIGRLHRSKGPHILLKAFDILVNKKKYRDAELVYIGPDKGMKEYLIRYSRNRGLGNKVKVLGYLSETEKLSALQASLFLVLPSTEHFETFPITISEAWAKEKPVIASAVGGIVDRVGHMVNGLLVLPNDPLSLSDAMELLLNDENLRREFGESGRRDVVTWEKVADMTIKEYIRAINNKNN